MVIRFQNGVFVADSSYAEKDAVKAAGFWWHGGQCRPNCGACKAGLPLRVWWTPKAEMAARLAEYADEGAKAALVEVQKVLAASRATHVEATESAPARQYPVPDGLSYLPFQVAGISWMESHPQTLLGDEMGLGKTVQILGLINALPSIESILIICPASLRVNWQREAARWLCRVVKVQVIDDKHPLPDPHANIVIANFDRIRDKEVHAALMAREWDLLVVDECHRVKNPKAAQTKAVLGSWNKETKSRIDGLVHRAKRAVFATGTPVPNRPVELHPILAALNPREFCNWKRFVERYCAAYKDRYGWKVDGASHLDELQQRLRTTLMIRRLKRDVLTELPLKRRQLVPLAVNGAAKVVAAEWKAYRDHEDAIAQAEAEMELAEASDDETAYVAAVAKLRAAQKVAFTEMARQRREVAVAKVPAALEHLKDMLDGSEGQKIVIMAHHHEVIDALAAGLNDYGVVVLTGDTAMDDRTTAVDRFQTCPDVRVFIGSITAAGVGLTLTASSTVVFVELDWVPANMTQAEDRVHRIGQTLPVLIQHLVFDGSLDQQMAATLVSKQNVADKALDLDTTITLTDDQKARAAAQQVSREAWLAQIKASLERQDEKRKLAGMNADQRAVWKASNGLTGEINVEERLRGMVHGAMREIAAMCDGAQARDGMGFSKAHSYLGRGLAALETLNDKQAWLALRLCRIYRRQLSAEVRDALAEAIGDNLDETTEKKGA